MFSTGFTMGAEAAAESAAETRAYLSGLARLLGVHVLGGYVDPAKPRPKNACSLFGPNGREAIRYHKIHPFTLAGEPDHYSAGDSLATAGVDDLRVTPLICYDLRFPEPFRAAAPATDLFVVVANWPERRRDAWIALLAARAIENQCFVLGVNRVGEGDGIVYSGDTRLVDPFGRVRASASADPAVVSGPVDAAEVAGARERFSFLADRRPDVYARLREGGEGR
jgi:predicted amidohydrolase